MIIHLIGVTATRKTIAGGSASTDLISSNRLDDYSFLTEPFTLDQFGVILHCVSGLGPTGGQVNINLGNWIFNGAQVSFGDTCVSVFQQRSANNNNFPGVINLYPCGPLSPDEEGVYSCMMMNSSMVVQTTRVGLYLSGRSESLDMYPHHLIVNHLSSLYTAAPIIDPPSSSTVTVVVGNSLTLSCTSRSSPPDTFTWMKDGTPAPLTPTLTTVTHDSTTANFRSNFTISSINETDSGVYTCTVTNPIGSDSQTITVFVVTGELMLLYHI